MANTTTVLSQILIDETGAANIPWEYHIMIVILSWILFFGSVWIKQNADILAVLSTVFFAVAAALTPYVEFMYVNFLATTVGSTDYIYVASAAYHPYVPYVMYIWVGMFLVGIINCYRIWLLHLEEMAEKKRMNDARLDRRI